MSEYFFGLDFSEKRWVGKDWKVDLWETMV